VSHLRTVVVRGAFGALLLGLVPLAHADAPSDQYFLFNSTSVVIEDLHTGLYWQRTAAATPMTVGNAATYCNTLSLGMYPTGWRVPSYKELMTLVDETPFDEYVNGALQPAWIDGDAFPFADVTAPYWTSSAYVPTQGYYYAVDFGSGVPTALPPGTSLLVRCVH
jgi:Protein of unknown function (DUF1566)